MTNKSKNRRSIARVATVCALLLLLGSPWGAIARAETPELPEAVARAVLADLSRETEIPENALTIVAAERETWPDGCLGLAEPDRFCTQALVSGWEVSIRSARREWTYRTDDTGATVKLDRGHQLKSRSRQAT
jgi:hypothetical protein